MKLIVLGATGQTGETLVTQALRDGHEVTALVRNVSKMAIQHEKLQVAEANIFSADSLAEHFRGNDAIISCLGFQYKIFSSISGYTNSMTAIVGAMRQTGVNRMVTMTSWYTDTSSARNASFFVRNLLVPLIKSVLTNMMEMEKYLEEECSDLNWTVVRPPGLQNTPVTGGILQCRVMVQKTSSWGIQVVTKIDLSGEVTEKEILTHEGYFVPDEKGYPITNTVSRADVSRFMLSTLNDNMWTRKIVAMCCK